MRICILANESQQAEILSKKTNPGVKIIWTTDILELTPGLADVYIDLTFENKIDRIQALKTLVPATVIINSVTHTTKDTDPSFIRINGWPGFLSKKISEVAVSQDGLKVKATHIMEQLGWEFQLVRDLPGMIAPRVIAMIVNEAYFALGEAVSTKPEIDTAMKLGTNYPFGPFEWSEKIGLKSILELLSTMSASDPAYLAAELLQEEAAGM